MPYVGLAKTSEGPLGAYRKILSALEREGFNVRFSKHHWAGDMPFGLVLAETDLGDVAVRWSLGREFELKLEEIDEEAFEDFVEETLDYIGGD
ncbi:hypothetical protein [Palaeococcus ferrophilus]|uniref:hypothetical protein n=1 Tax=Palaeococcus ferrophilus TaxID=83868 RepID=UPI00064F353B|nr:hypothetical protein [Palaeococcus ferrophilus]